MNNEISTTPPQDTTEIDYDAGTIPYSDGERQKDKLSEESDLYVIEDNGVRHAMTAPLQDAGIEWPMLQRYCNTPSTRHGRHLSWRRLS